MNLIIAIGVIFIAFYFQSSHCQNVTSCNITDGISYNQQCSSTSNQSDFGGEAMNVSRAGFDPVEIGAYSIPNYGKILKYQLTRENFTIASKIVLKFSPTVEKIVERNIFQGVLKSRGQNIHILSPSLLYLDDVIEVTARIWLPNAEKTSSFFENYVVKQSYTKDFDLIEGTTKLLPIATPIFHCCGGPSDPRTIIVN